MNYRAPVAVLAFVLSLAVGLPAQNRVFPVDELRPGMTAVGRTVFEGDKLEEFKVHILGVLRNVIGPKRDLILARLEGGPLANAGVIAGMSGSPVYIDGRLVGAVSYSLGEFSKEPIAGITPIAEMLLTRRSRLHGGRCHESRWPERSRPKASRRPCGRPSPWPGPSLRARLTCKSSAT